MSEGSQRLAAVRLVRRGRGEARTTGDLAYAVYACVLLLAIVGVPVVHAMVLALSSPAARGALTSSAAGPTLVGTVGLLLAALVLVGQVRGPALVSPFAVAAVASTDLPRRVALRSPFLASAAVLAGAFVSLAAVVAVASRPAGSPWSPTVELVAGAAALGALASVVWLLGQRLAPAHAAGLAGLLAGLAALLVLGVTLLPGLAATALPSVALLALVAAATVPRLLDALAGSTLLDQARRWEAAGAASSAGDLSGALAQLRVRPRAGRRWWAVRGRSTVTRFLVRDLVGAARTPARCVGASLVLVLSGAVMAYGLVVGAVLGPVVTAAGSVLAYLALGAFSDGLRHAVEAAAAPALYRHGARALCALHCAAPTACGLVLTGLGASVAAAAGGVTVPVALSTAATVAALACFLVLDRLRDSARGPLPLALLAPVPTPAGDVSGVAVLLWQADAVLLAGLVAALACSVAGSAGPVLVALAGAGLVLLSTGRRLRG